MIFSFEDWELDSEVFELRKSGKPQDMEPLAFNLLQFLIHNRHRVVSRDEIVEEIWDGRIVTEATISTCIKVVRKSIGDDGQTQRLIKTAHGRGFRFVGEVETVKPETSPAEAEPETKKSKIEPLDQEISFVTAKDGVRVAVAKIGEGPVILRAAHWLSHVSLDHESPVFNHWFRLLSSKNQFVRYDLRGSGLSDRTVEDMSFDAFLSDLEAVADTIEEPFTLLGLSQGGALSIAYALKHPEKVKQLILFGAYGQGALARATTDEERMMVDTLLNLIHLGWGRENPAFNQIFTNLFIPGGTEEQHNWWRELERNTATPEYAIRVMEANNRIDVFDKAAQLKVPTIVFHCRQDTRVPFDQGRRLAATINGARFVTLESANHCILDDEPAWEVFRSEVEPFLGT